MIPTFPAVLALLAPLGVATPAPAHPHLDRLRLLPEVLVEGEKGWSLDERMKRYKIEGVSVAVFGGGRVLWAEARGNADREAGAAATAETLFQAGSISKPVAAAAVLRKVEAGALRLDADVNTYLTCGKSRRAAPPPARRSRSNGSCPIAPGSRSTVFPDTRRARRFRRSRRSSTERPPRTPSPSASRSSPARSSSTRAEATRSRSS